jgi:hypothetical protein
MVPVTTVTAAVKEPVGDTTTCDWLNGLPRKGSAHPTGTWKVSTAMVGWPGARLHSIAAPREPGVAPEPDTTTCWP